MARRAPTPLDDLNAFAINLDSDYGKIAICDAVNIHKNLVPGGCKIMAKRCEVCGKGPQFEITSPRTIDCRGGLTQLQK
jgi:hypothetical protein